MKGGVILKFDLDKNPMVFLDRYGNISVSFSSKNKSQEWEYASLKLFLVGEAKSRKDAIIKYKKSIEKDGKKTNKIIWHVNEKIIVFF